MPRTLGFLAVLSLSACEGERAPAPSPAADGAAAAALVQPGDAPELYHQAHQELCPSPACAGVQLDPVNRGEWACPLGGDAESCQVHELDYGPSGLDEDGVAAAEAAIAEGRALLRGAVTTEPDPDVYGGTLARLHVTEAWVGVTGSEPVGRFARERNSGLVCITTPCPSIDESALNSSRTAELAELDFAYSGADDAEIQAGLRAMDSDSGLVVAGRIYQAEGPGGTAPARAVSELYLRID